MPVLIPPRGWGMVDDDLYRSSVPIDLNFPFLDALRLRTLVYLSHQPPSFALQAFVNDQNLSYPSPSPSSRPLRLLHLSPSSIEREPLSSPSLHPSSSSPSPSRSLPSSSSPPPLSEEAVITVLSLFLDPSSLPLLLCCPTGRHATGAVVGCWRKTCGWSLSSIFAEYRRYAGPGHGVGENLNEQFIELFDTELVGGRKERERRRRGIGNGSGADRERRGELRGGD